MGADFITTNLIARRTHIGREMVTYRSGYTAEADTYDWALDWDAGKSLIGSFCDGLEDADLEEACSELGVQSYDEDEEADRPLAVVRAEVAKALRDKLDETKESLGLGESHWRDVGGFSLPIHGTPKDSLVFFETGGMSWGDGPTEAFDLWTMWQWQWLKVDVLEAVGFVSWDKIEVVVTE